MAVLFYSWFWISLTQLYAVNEILSKIEKFKSVVNEGPFNRVEGFRKIKYYKNTYILEMFHNNL